MARPNCLMTKPELSAIEPVEQAQSTNEIDMKKQSEKQKKKTNNLVRKAFASKIKRQKKLAERKKTAVAA